MSFFSYVHNYMHSDILQATTVKWLKCTSFVNLALPATMWKAFLQSLITSFRNKYRHRVHFLTTNYHMRFYSGKLHTVQETLTSEIFFLIRFPLTLSLSCALLSLRHISEMILLLLPSIKQVSACRYRQKFQQNAHLDYHYGANINDLWSVLNVIVRCNCNFAI